MSNEADTQQRWAAEQLELKHRLSLRDQIAWTLDPGQPNTLKYIGGVDISFVKDNNIDACAALVVLKYPELEVVYENFKLVQIHLPYIPGFLAFREVGALLMLIDELKSTRPDLLPQLIFVDGNGYLHPRGFGLACHLGVLTGIPTIGVGKTLMHVDGLTIDKVKGQFKKTCTRPGDFCYLVGETGETWGAALLGAAGCVNPVFISVGHRISLETAIKATIACCRYRIPEPVRIADIRSREWLRLHN